MLILTRHIGESVFIGDDIQVVTLGIRGNVVRLGIEAPRTIEVHREEIYKHIINGNISEDSREFMPKRDLDDILRVNGARYGVR